MHQEHMTIELLPEFKGTKDDESNINVTFEVLFRAETLKKIKFPPEIFMASASGSLLFRVKRLRLSAGIRKFD